MFKKNEKKENPQMGKEKRKLRARLAALESLEWLEVGHFPPSWDIL